MDFLSSFFSSRVITVSATFFYYCSFYVKYILLFYSDSQMAGNGKKRNFLPRKILPFYCKRNNKFLHSNFLFKCSRDFFLFSFESFRVKRRMMKGEALKNLCKCYASYGTKNINGILRKLTSISCSIVSFYVNGALLVIVHPKNGKE